MTVGRPSGSFTVVTYPFGLCKRKYSSRSRLLRGFRSTQITSSSGSAFVPCSTTTFPLSVTRPAAIISSALRRDAIPQAAIIFCSRSEATVGGFPLGSAGACSRFSVSPGDCSWTSSQGGKKSDGKPPRSKQNLVFRPVLFSVFSAFSVLSATSVLNSPFFFHHAPRPPSHTSPTSPHPSAQSTGISPAESPPPSPAPIQSPSTFPPHASPLTTRTP